MDWFFKKSLAGVLYRCWNNRFFPEKAPAKNRHFFHRPGTSGRGLIFLFVIKKIRKNIN